LQLLTSFTLLYLVEVEVGALSVSFMWIDGGVLVHIYSAVFGILLCGEWRAHAAVAVGSSHTNLTV
jgi:hypothetical protein